MNERDEQFEQLVQEAKQSQQPNWLPPQSSSERKTGIWLNCALMLSPVLVSVLPTILLDFPFFSFIFGFVFAAPGAVFGIVKFATGSTITQKQAGRSFFIGCAIAFIYGMISNWDDYPTMK